AEAERQRQGEKRRGREPKPVDETPSDKAQMSFTDAELHIMRTNNKGWDYCGNAQASVDEAYQIILTCDVTDETNDKKQAEPMAQAILETLEQAGIERPTDDRGEPAAIVATLDNGYYSEAAAQALEELGFDPYIAAGRVPHHGAPPETPEAPKTAKERMAAKVRSALGRALYARRKVIAEPVSLNLSQFVEDQNGPAIGQNHPSSLCWQWWDLRPHIRSVRPAQRHSVDESCAGTERSPRIPGG